MATAKPKDEPAAAPAAEAPVDRPIVLEYKRGKKKSKKQGYSKQFRDLQVSEGKIAKASEKLARAVAKGAAAYNDARKDSQSKKRDGAIRDFGPNLAVGLSESIREASSLPLDVADALNTKTARRMMRSQFRVLRSGLRFWRL